MTIVDSARHAVRSPAFKFLVVLVLTLALSIPLLFVYALVYEREQYAGKATRDVSRMWANAQTISGPFVIVPTETDREVVRKAGSETRTVRGLAAFLPENLNVEGELKSETLQRGIFSVPVYRGDIKMTGRFIAPDWQRVTGNADRVLWDKAELVVLISDVRGIKTTAAITINQTNQQFRAGAGLEGQGTPGIHVPITEAAIKSGFDFSFALKLNGSQSLRFVPAGGETDVALRSDWAHPSFIGQFLPDQRKISKNGFTANWKIPRLARGQGQEMSIGQISQLRAFQAFGVKFFQPLRFYSLAQRALKYALGFIAIAFLAVFVMEIQSHHRVHWIQYMFVGLALIIFYVLLVGTAEHIGFDMGYTAAALATSVLIGSYFATLTNSLRYGAALFGVLGLIYGLLYLLLRLEDYALLVGSLAAFSLIALVMFATRHVDWTRTSEAQAHENS